MESVNIDPNLECQVQQQFEATQNQQQLEFLALEESLKNKYLVGSASLGMTLCQRKMESDMLFVRVRLATAEVGKSIKREETTLFGRLGLIGMLVKVECYKVLD